MAMTDLTIIRRSLVARLFSTITTIITVAVAVALMIVLVTMQDAGRKAFKHGSGDMHLLVSADPGPLVAVLNGVFYANPPQRPIPWAKYEEIAGSFPYEYAVPTQLGDSYRGQPVMATTRAFFEKFKPDVGRPWQLAQGRIFAAPFEIVLGAGAARHTGLTVGQEVHLSHGASSSRKTDDGHHANEHTEFEYTVVGIMKPTGGSHDRALFTDLDSAWTIHAHDRRTRNDPNATTTPADLTEADKLITGILLRLPTREGSAAPAALPQVFYKLRSDPQITVASPSDQIEKLFVIVGSLNQIFIAMAFVVMISSGIGIMLALYNSMEQRRRQIAVLRVLGASRSRIFGLIVTESAFLGVFGAVVGVGLSIMAMRIVAAAMQMRLGLVIEPNLIPAWTLAIGLGTVALAAVAGVLPAVMAYRTSVAKNLRPIG